MVQKVPRKYLGYHYIEDKQLPMAEQTRNSRDGCPEFLGR